MPAERRNGDALGILAVADSFSFDYILRLKVAATVNLFILAGCAFPSLDERRRHFLTHAALRLTCNHAGYEPLWREQVGDTWREPTPPFTWPVLADDDTRWAVRASIDAVVAQAYGLSRAQYEHVLSSFSHRSYPKAPDRCLAAFDELTEVGLAAFTRKHDPYWDIPLNESLPQPVIDLPGIHEPAGEEPLPADETRSADVVSLRPRRTASSRGQYELPGLGSPQGQFGFMAAEPEAPYGEATSDESRAGERPATAATGGKLGATDLQVAACAEIIRLHEVRGSTAGNVKMEKCVDLLQRRFGLPFERTPVRDAAGPVDFQQQQKNVRHRAEKVRAFKVTKGRTGGVWSRGPGLEKWTGKFRTAMGEDYPAIAEFLKQVVAFRTDQAEIVATLYAEWDHRITRGERVDDDALVAAFFDWHEAKRRNFTEERARKALEWMRSHGFVPTGSGVPLADREIKPSPPRKRKKSGRAQDDGTYATLAALLKERGSIASGDAQEATGLDAAGVRPYLKRLVDEGKARTEGQRRGMRYVAVRARVEAE